MVMTHFLIQNFLINISNNLLLLKFVLFPKLSSKTEPEPTFPYKLVEIRRDEKLIDRYELLSEELGRYVPLTHQP